MQTEAVTSQLKRGEKKKKKRCQRLTRTSLTSERGFDFSARLEKARVCAAALPLCPSESNLHAAAMKTSDGECDPMVTSAFIVFTQAGNVLMGTAAKARTSASINKRSQWLWGDVRSKSWCLAQRLQGASVVSAVIALVSTVVLRSDANTLRLHQRRRQQFVHVLLVELCLLG